MTERGVPGLYIDSDMREGIHAAAVVGTFMQQLSTPAHKKTVIKAMHTRFADEFDRYMQILTMGPERRHLHHVYEYSETGDPYQFIGMPEYKLWRHTINTGTGAHANFSWRWLPSKSRNPTYQQRRDSDLGWDAIRDIPQEDFDRLVNKSANRRHRFIWKAPILEYGIRTSIEAKGKALALPMPGGVLMFRKHATSERQQPGSTAGHFSRAWTQFWSTQVESRFDEVLGDAIAKDAELRITQALASGKKRARKYTNTFAFTAVTDAEEAFLAGRQQALAAVRFHQKRIKGIEKHRGRVDI